MTKKYFLIVLCLFSLTTTVLNAQSLWKNGDINHDYQVNIVDALLIAQYYVGIIDIDTSLGNVNCDNQVNIVDALLIAQFYVGIYSTLPYCQATLAPSPSPANQHTPNPTPEERHVSVLPVFFVPTDQRHLIPDPKAPGKDLNANLLGHFNLTATIANVPTYYGSYQEFFNRALYNLSAQLQMAQIKYEIMIEESTGKNFGSFKLSTWNTEYSVSEFFDPQVHGQINPLIFESSFDSKMIMENIDNYQYPMMTELLSYMGYTKENCPYIFFTVYVFNPSPGSEYVSKPNARGTPFLSGFNSGGFVQSSYRGIRDCHIPGTHGLSTIIHELGHSFGMPHIWFYMTATETNQYSDTACTNIPFPTINYSKYCSSSIMSYNTNNWIEGGILNSPPEGDSQGKENNYYILFEDTPYLRQRIKETPGILIPENIEHLSRNHIVFPELEYNPSDYPGYSVRIKGGLATPNIPEVIK